MFSLGVVDFTKYDPIQALKYYYNSSESFRKNMSHHMGELWRRGFGVEAFNSHISNYIGHGGFNQDYVMPQIKNLPFRNVKYWTEEDKKIAAAYMPKISMALSFLPLTYGRLKQEGLIIAPQEGRAKGKIIPISENPVEWFKSL